MRLSDRKKENVPFLRPQQLQRARKTMFRIINLFKELHDKIENINWRMTIILLYHMEIYVNIYKHNPYLLV